MSYSFDRNGYFPSSTNLSRLLNDIRVLHPLNKEHLFLYNYIKKEVTNNEDNNRNSAKY